MHIYIPIHTYIHTCTRIHNAYMYLCMHTNFQIFFVNQIDNPASGSTDGKFTDTGLPLAQRELKSNARTFPEGS